ncbi:MAG: hypothetical protein MZW92_69385 [Comamonadaceae bacterium]|nr:hypothetical protein [Comamonadaceae bacterium]
MLEEYLLRAGPRVGALRLAEGARDRRRRVLAGAAQFAAARGRSRSLVRAVRLPQVPRLRRDRARCASCTSMIRAETQATRARGAAGTARTTTTSSSARGGIREIEFIAQTLQVMRGGRDARLRDTRTLAHAGRAGAAAACCAPATARGWPTDYVFLRRLEHALQYVDDAQTHLLPGRRRGALRRRRGACSASTGGRALQRCLDALREFVARPVDAVFLTPAAAPTAERAPADATGAALPPTAARGALPIDSDAPLESLPRVRWRCSARAACWPPAARARRCGRRAGCALRGGWRSGAGRRRGARRRRPTRCWRASCDCSSADRRPQHLHRAARPVPAGVRAALLRLLGASRWADATT